MTENFIMAKPSWITLSASSGSGSKNVSVTASENIAAARTGTITVKTSSGLTKSVSLAQNTSPSCAVTLSNVVISSNFYTTCYGLNLSLQDSSRSYSIINGKVPSGTVITVGRNYTIPYESVRLYVPSAGAYCTKFSLSWQSCNPSPVSWNLSGLDILGGSGGTTGVEFPSHATTQYGNIYSMDLDLGVTFSPNTTYRMEGQMIMSNN